MKKNQVLKKLVEFNKAMKDKRHDFMYLSISVEVKLKAVKILKRG